jgi:hypothetical protein
MDFNSEFLSFVKKNIKGPITTNINFVNATEKNKESNVKIIRGLIHRINSQ